MIEFADDGRRIFQGYVEMLQRFAYVAAPYQELRLLVIQHEAPAVRHKSGAHRRRGLVMPAQ